MEIDLDTVVLKKPASIRVGGMLFKKGEPRFDVPEELVTKLKSNPRFSVRPYREGDENPGFDASETGDITKSEVVNPRRSVVPPKSTTKPTPAPVVTDADKPTVEDLKAEEEEGRPSDKGKRLQAISEAAELLEEGNPEHFTRGGKADARALSSILGWSVTAAERDEAVPTSSTGTDEEETDSTEDAADESEAETEATAEDATEETAKPAGKVKVSLKKPADQADPTKGGGVEV